MFGGAGHSRGQAARDAAGRGEDRRAHPAARPQRHDGRGVAVQGEEAVGELLDAAHVGAAEPVDGLVGVTDDDEVAAVPGEVVQKRLLRGVGVLVLVHEHDVVGVLLPDPDLLVGEEAGGHVDQLAVVVGGDGVQREPVGVALHERADGNPVVASAEASEGDEVFAEVLPLDRPEGEVAQFLGEPARGEGGPQPLRPVARPVGQFALQQAAHLQELLRAGQQSRWRLVVQHRVAPEQRVGVAVEGEGERRSRGAVEAARDALPQLPGGLAAERQDQDALRVDAPVLDAVDDRLDDRRRLPGARPRQHQQRPAGVLHDPPLLLVEHGRDGPRGTRAAHETVGS